MFYVFKGMGYCVSTPIVNYQLATT